MKQDKRDRRSQRTRRLVSSAMLELLSEKGYEAITVQDILDRAGIGRSTFYSHYYDKDDVHASMMEEMIEEMNRRLNERQAGQAFLPSLELFQHIRQDRKHIQAVADSPSGGRFWDMLQVALNRQIEKSLKSARKDPKAASVPLPAVSAYLTGAFLSLLKWWLKAGMPYSPEEMDGIFQELASPGVWATLGKKAGSARLSERESR